jgi:hypothetical protein
VPTVRTKLACAILAICAFAFAASSAQAEFYVPPSNSAVNQYTQNEPSAGGDKTGRKEAVKPAEALGEKNAKKLEEKGAAGRAAAELAANTDPRNPEDATTTEVETAPVEEAPEEAAAPAKKHHKKQKAKQPPKQAKHHAHKKKGGEGGAAPSEGGGKPPAAKPSGPGPSGASATGEVVSHATGLSGGTLGIFLPLVIVAAIAGSVLFVLRGRRHDGQPVA